MVETCVFASDLTLFEGLVWKLMNLQIKWGQCSEWHDWYKGFKEQQTTVWSGISKARASLKASSIHPETQQRAAEQILQTTRCKNGSLKCQSLIHSIWRAPCASCLSAMPQNGSEKRRGLSITIPDHPLLRRIRKGWAPGLRQGKQNNPYLTLSTCQETVHTLLLSSLFKRKKKNHELIYMIRVLKVLKSQIRFGLNK